ncbi:DnaA regulatory inactivator Hda [Thalassotalea ganghwensis]
MKKQAQLALQVTLPDDETFTSFRGNANAIVVAHLKSYLTSGRITPEQTHVDGCYLFGQKGVGKSHLMHSCCSFATEHKLTSICLSLKDITSYDVDVLDGLEHMNVVCLDDIDVIAQQDNWQQGVFDLYNRVGEQGNKIIISGNKAINELNLTLPDLVSRLSWGYVEQLKALEDDEKLEALQFRASQRGLVLNYEVANFLITRLSREMKSLLEALDELDKASIREQRKITIPFIKQVLMSD